MWQIFVEPLFFFFFFFFFFFYSPLLAIGGLHVGELMGALAVTYAAAAAMLGPLTHCAGPGNQTQASAVT